MELAVQVQELSSLLPQLSSRDLGFATSLINQFARKGSLSDKQSPWVTKLLALAKGTNPAPAQRTTANVGDLSGLLDLFNNAGGKLKHPKIRLQVSGTAIVLNVAGAKAKVPGSINIATEGTFGNNTWFGRVSPAGQFDGSRELTPEFASALLPVLTQLAVDPLAAVQKYGKLTGSCCFCGKTLSGEDGKSKAAGMGKKCADNFGLTAQYKAAVPSGI